MDFVRCAKLLSSVESPLHGAAIGTANLPLAKGQDYVFTYQHRVVADGSEDVDGSDCDILAVFDGHGSVKHPERDFMRILREAPLASLLLAADPVQSLVDYLRSFDEQYDCTMGAVGSIVRIFNDRIETFNVGDSATLVFIDGVLAYRNSAHNSVSPREVDRLKAWRDNGGCCHYSIEPGFAPGVVDGSTITCRPSHYTVFNQLDKHIKLAPSQSFGHHGITGYCPDTATIPYSPEQRVHVVLASDGLMDMVSCDGCDLDVLSSQSASELAAFAERRWKQSWRYVYQGKTIRDGYRFDDFDDIGVATWSLSP